MNNFPDPEKIIGDWIQSRAEAGVVLAQAVTAIIVHESRMTVHIAPQGIARAKEWPAAISVFPEGIAEFYAVEFSWLNEQAEYLRQKVSTLEVRDVDGNRVGKVLNTAEYQQRKNPNPFV